MNALCPHTTVLCMLRVQMMRAATLVNVNLDIMVSVENAKVSNEIVTMNERCHNNYRLLIKRKYTICTSNVVQ